MDEHKRIEELARKLGVSVPDDIRIVYWSLPILERIVQILEDRDIVNEWHGVKDNYE